MIFCFVVSDLGIGDVISFWYVLFLASVLGHLLKYLFRQIT